MPDFYDIGLRKRSEKTKEKAEEIGWERPELETAFLEASEWGELKKKINEERDQNDVMIFLGGDEELNRKAAGDTRIDVLLHPEKGRKDSGINHVIAEEAAENNVAVGFDLKQLRKSEKSQAHVLRHWMKNLRICEKYNTPYIITSGAGDEYELKPPRELAALIDSLGFEGKKAVSDFPKNIVERTDIRKEDGFVRPGVEKGDNK